MIELFGGLGGGLEELEYCVRVHRIGIHAFGVAPLEMRIMASIAGRRVGKGSHCLCVCVYNFLWR